MVNIRVKVRVKATDTVNDEVWKFHRWSIHSLKLRSWERKWCGTFAPGRVNGTKVLLPLSKNCCCHYTAHMLSRDHKTPFTVQDLLKLVGLRIRCGLVKQSWVGNEAAGIIKACRHSAPVDKGITRRQYLYLCTIYTLIDHTSITHWTCSATNCHYTTFNYVLKVCINHW